MSGSQIQRFWDIFSPPMILTCSRLWVYCVKMSSQWTCSYRTQKQYVIGYMSGHVEQEKSPPSLRRDHRLLSSERLIVSWVGLSANAGHLSKKASWSCSRDVVSYLVACQTCYLTQLKCSWILGFILYAWKSCWPWKGRGQSHEHRLWKPHVHVILSMAANGQACVQTFLSSLMWRQLGLKFRLWY